MTARRLRPRPPITSAPLAVSDQTCLDLAGLTPRQLRDLLAAHPEVPRATIGRRVVVRADVLLSLLARLEVSKAPPEPFHEAPATVDDLLAEVGRRAS